eukprot:10564302-Lingulodinium_polyedra.AAC.1
MQRHGTSCTDAHAWNLMQCHGTSCMEPHAVLWNLMHGTSCNVMEPHAQQLHQLLRSPAYAS